MNIEINFIKTHLIRWVFFLYICFMKNYIRVGYEIIDGRLYLDLGTNKETIEYTETLTVISGALSMVIRLAAESGYETEGEVMRSVVSYLESEFINPDSFSDLEVKRPNDGENSK